ncbi:hypothetical protein KP509_11G022500 [Ceratopteris richardii]|nr:hypothetical protein KP509_11G022500 [Ceratopteris richardii]
MAYVTPVKASIMVKEPPSIEQVRLPKLEEGRAKMCVNGSIVTLDDEDHPGFTFFGKDATYWVLMVASSAALVLGLSSASLLGRYYYVHGGSRRWLYTWVQSAGWPVLIPPLLVGYCTRQRPHAMLQRAIKPTHSITPKLSLIYTALGALVTFDNLLYSMGCSYLPVSTNSLLCSSQLAFNAVLTYLLVGQKMTPYIFNSIFIITVGTILLGMGAGSDKPLGTSKREYVVGVIATVAASGLYALLLPLLQLVYGSKDVRKAMSSAVGAPPPATAPTITAPPTTLVKIVLETDAPANRGGIDSTTGSHSSAEPSFLLVLEVQIAVSMLASMFALLGMCINADLSAMHSEALNFDGGPLAYLMVLGWSAIGWQLYFVGVSGIVFLTSSLMSCVFSTVMIAVVPILAVIFFHDTFSATKGIAMVLSIWGFISYIYDGYMAYKNKQDEKSNHLEEVSTR